MAKEKVTRDWQKYIQTPDQRDYNVYKGYKISWDEYYSYNQKYVKLPKHHWVDMRVPHGILWKNFTKTQPQITTALILGFGGVFLGYAGFYIRKKRGTLRPNEDYYYIKKGVM